jgi:glycosyltransferase involved in cell wall biosynthesis/uncharacterized coiled-coil protein SlyX
MSSRVLIVCSDLVGSMMAGPGIRALEIARILAKEHFVTLAVPGKCDLSFPEFKLKTYIWGKKAALEPLLAQADVVIGQGFVFEAHPELLAADLPLAIDLYDPLILEGLELYAKNDLATAENQHFRYQKLTEAQLQRGDFFFCATEQQRAYWLGALTAMGRITPNLARQADRDLYTFLDLVPSGISSQPPLAEKPVLRGVHPAIKQNDLIFLWAGGLWDWFDPAIIVHAVAKLQVECPQMRLCFFAGARPNPFGKPFFTRKRQEAEALAKELGVFNRSVIFLDAWIPYQQRGAYLAEADVGLSAHLPGLETQFAFRTRLLDYLWARLPVICTAGDSLGTEISQHGAGFLVAPNDVQGWITTLRKVYFDLNLRKACHQAADNLANRYLWAKVVQPLATFCAQPRRTALYDSHSNSNHLSQRITELEHVLAEREQYVQHVEQQYALALANSPFRKLRARLHTLLRRFGLLTLLK